MKEKKELIPPDLKRCQHEYQGGSFMTFGPRPHIRCEAKPVVVITETRVDPEYGKAGSMSLCQEHLDAAYEVLGKKKFTVEDIQVVTVKKRVTKLVPRGR